MKVSLLHKTLLATTLFFLATSVVSAQSSTGQARRATKPSPAAVSETRVRSCEARKDAVTNRMASLVRFANNMLEKFSAISLRVQQFYTDKVLPTGVTVANYDALLKDVADKKAVVETAVAKAQADVDDFSCDDSDIRDQYSTFRQNMQAVKQALQNYRTAIKNLIVAVHSALPTPTPSPTPTATPSPTPTPAI